MLSQALLETILRQLNKDVALKFYQINHTYAFLMALINLLRALFIV